MWRDVLKLINCPWYFVGHFHSNFFISAKWTFYHLRLNLWLYRHLQCNYNELEYKNYSWACLFFVPKKVLSPSPVWDTLCTLYEIIYATLSLSSSIHHIPPNFLIFLISVKRWHLIWTRQCGRDSSSLLESPDGSKGCGGKVREIILPKIRPAIPSRDV